MRGRLAKVGRRARPWVSMWVPMVLAATVAGAAPSPFARPPALEPNVAFWRDVFARYSENETVIHDGEDLDRVYAVLDFRSWAGPNGRLDAKHERMRDEREREALRYYAGLLRRLRQKGGKGEAGPSADERRVRALFDGRPDPATFGAAADRVRAQAGLRERFRAGVARWKGYRAAMEAIFRQKGLPPELTRLSLVESTFDLEAYSRVGAAGVWQFMPTTGRQYLRIDGAVDERRDPLRSTRAAAEHLRRDYEALRAWPLAITAYNHGRGGMVRAARELGTKDIGAIVRRYQGRRFGFASRNFYAEFLAAVDVTTQEEKYFGSRVAEVAAPASREVPLRQPMRLHHAARHVGVASQTLIAMNPAFLARVVDGRTAIPRGYRLRVPRTSEDARLARAQADARRLASGKPLYVVHEVRRGQTLGGIAQRYGTTVATLQHLNGIRRPRSLQVGQILKVPAG